MKHKIEILAPAGSFECLLAALKSGADAVYVGGSRFGARAFANNFDEEELKKAIDLVHLHGKQLYLTVNTLLKEREISTELYQYLAPLYEHGLDAVIVQDLGVLQFVKKHFPDLPIHASTQMTVTNVLGAKFLKDLGVERVVTARELSLAEVKQIADETNLEIESFVHGALCYCYSGQCLYSSMVGGRSGNRGQCAQPCRLPYKVDDMSSYVMSLKDICTLENIPEIIESGVYSFKIEGRMKKPEYVASVSAMYRKYVDMYMTSGRKGYKVNPQDLDDLRDIFNRGDFHGGYWKQHNGPNMITPDLPSHTGVAVIQVQSQNGRIVVGKVLKPLQKGDILDISKGGDNYTLGTSYSVNDRIELSIRKGVRLNQGQTIYRTRNQTLINKIHSHMDTFKLQQAVSGTLTAFEGEDITLHLNTDDVSISVVGDVVGTAQKAPLTEETICKQMNKTGNSSFFFQDLDIYIGDQIFVPMQQLNQLRREGLEQLEQAIISRYRRTLEPKVSEQLDDGTIIENTSKSDGYEWIAYVETLEQLECVNIATYIQKVYMDCNIVNEVWANVDLKKYVEQTRAAGKKVYLAMPHIFRESTAIKYQKHWSSICNIGFNGMVIRNLECMEFLKANQYKQEIITDHHVYVYNNEANTFWYNQGIARQTNSFELTAKELKNIDQTHMELVIYGYTPMMISAQCIKKTIHGCDKSFEKIKMTDRMNKEFIIKNHCDYCYNVIYNNCPTSIIEEKAEIGNISPSGLRLNFTIEDSSKTNEILEMVHSVYIKDESCKITGETTKGHFRRGIG